MARVGGSSELEIFLKIISNVSERILGTTYPTTIMCNMFLMKIQIDDHSGKFSIPSAAFPQTAAAVKCRLDANGIA